jgi:hypothetical protein
VLRVPAEWFSVAGAIVITAGSVFVAYVTARLEKKAQAERKETESPLNVE